MAVECALCPNRVKEFVAKGYCDWLDWNVPWRYLALSLASLVSLSAKHTLVDLKRLRN